MGTTQSYLSPEALVTAAVVAGAVGFGYTQVASSGNAEKAAPFEPAVGGVAGKKGKGKKKPNSTSGISTPIAENIKTPENISIVPFPAVIPGQFDNGVPDSSAGIGTEAKASSSKAKKGKKKKAGKVAILEDKSPSVTGQQTSMEESLVSPAAAATLANADITPVTAPSTKSSTKPKKKKQQASSQDLPKPSPSFAGMSTEAVPALSKAESTQRLQQSTASLASLATESDGEWTRVSRRTDKIHTSSIAGGTSDVGQTTSVTTGTSSPVDTRTEEEDEEQEEQHVVSGPGERNPLAKRLLPKPRKTGVEDMLATSDYPSYSRVMRVHEDVGADSLSGEPDADSAEADGEDDGWGVVKRGGRPKNKVSASQQSLSTPSRTASAPETMNKRQRQNAARREAEKSLKADAERERLATLARHKRELERAKMDAQFGKSGGKKSTSGGMKATIDEKGKLVWD